MKGGQNLAFKFIFSCKTLTFLSTETARIKKANLLVGLVKSKETRQKSLKLKNRLPLVGHLSINNAAKYFLLFRVSISASFVEQIVRFLVLDRYLFIDKIWPIPASFSFIFVLFSFQFQQ